ncbi:MAG TPA: O-antigen ligase domain-containing protein [Xanthobacteraceae bacterium]|nr:O-antigen ligase domain-containing protein [Xanthobacteraceae bacterium]
MGPTAIPSSVAAAPRRVSIERLRGGLLWLTGASGAFVFMEPGPYELTTLIAMLVFAATGLALRPGLMALVLLLTLHDLGYSFALIAVVGEAAARTWVVVSWYLSATALFFAAMLGVRTASRLDLLLRGTMASAIVTSAAAIGGYFHLVPGLSELFVRYGRAQGTFNDPNVLGAFLVLPILLALQRLLTGRPRAALGAALLLGLLAGALLLSFSRGAWGQCAFAAGLMMLLHLLTSPSPTARARIALMAILAVAALAAVVAALLTMEQVAAVFRERATLEQSYDLGRFGRFGRHVLGFLMALDRPGGLGPLQFRNFFPEDPHNAFLNAFMSGGWLSGFSYLTLTAVTIAAGLRTAFIATPWRQTFLAVYAAYVAVAAESAIIDSDHWRHYFLLLGVLWGLMIAARAHRARSWPATASRARAMTTG